MRFSPTCCSNWCQLQQAAGFCKVLRISRDGDATSSMGNLTILLSETPMFCSELNDLSLTVANTGTISIRSETTKYLLKGFS